MNRGLYIGVTLILYALEIYLAIIVNDIGNVFGFIGTIAGTSLSFFIPSVVYYKAFNRYSEDNDPKTLYYIGIANFILGVASFGLFLYANVL